MYYFETIFDTFLSSGLLIGLYIPISLLQVLMAFLYYNTFVSTSRHIDKRVFGESNWNYVTTRNSGDIVEDAILFEGTTYYGKVGSDKIEK